MVKLNDRIIIDDNQNVVESSNCKILRVIKKERKKFPPETHENFVPHRYKYNPNPEEVATIKEMVLSNAIIRVIAEKFCIDPNTVRRVAAEEIKIVSMKRRLRELPYNF